MLLLGCKSRSVLPRLYKPFICYALYNKYWENITVPALKEFVKSEVLEFPVTLAILCPTVSSYRGCAWRWQWRRGRRGDTCLRRIFYILFYHLPPYPLSYRICH